MKIAFAFIVYVIFACAFVMAYRFFITHTPLFEHDITALIGRAIVLCIYLCVVNLPVFLLLQNTYIQKNTITFGFYLAIIIIFIFTGLPALFSLNSQIIMIPWFVVVISFVKFLNIINHFIKNFTKYISYKAALIQGFKILFGILVGIIFFVLCIYFQIKHFAKYDFPGKNYGIPLLHKQMFSGGLGF